MRTATTQSEILEDEQNRVIASQDPAAALDFMLRHRSWEGLDPSALGQVVATHGSADDALLFARVARNCDWGQLRDRVAELEPGLLSRFDRVTGVPR